MVQMKNWDPLVSRPALAMAAMSAVSKYYTTRAYKEHQVQCA
jgi:hypothetical protein